MKNTYLFDFDGTLVDSMPNYIAGILRILDENNIQYNSDIVKIVTPLGYRGTAEYYQTLGITLSVEEMIKKMETYIQKAYVDTIQAKEYVVEVLQKLRDRGDSLNVLTASPHSSLDCCLKRLGIFELFDNVWSCDDFNTTKADVDIYRQAADLLGRRIEEIIFLDDNYNALMTAKTAGMRIYGVFDSSSDEYKNEIMSISEKYLKDLSGLIY